MNEKCCGKDNCTHVKGRCAKCGVSKAQHRTNHSFAPRQGDLSDNKETK